MNITIIAAIFVSLLRRLLGVRWGIILAGIGIAFYTILVGADAAVVRAAIMGGLTLLARILAIFSGYLDPNPNSTFGSMILGE